MPLLLLAALLGGCAAAPGLKPDPNGPAVELTGVPFYPQKRYQCGPAALAEVLSYTGDTVHPDDLTASLYIPARKGTLQAEIIAQGRRRGRLVYRVAPDMDALRAEVIAGHPVLVLQNLGLSWLPLWHYAVMVGVDEPAGTVVLRSGQRRRHVLPLTVFDRTWARSQRWGVLVLRPGQIPVTAAAHDYLKAAAALEAVDNARTALPAYRAGVRRWPDSAALRVALGNALRARGDLAGAEQALRAAIARSPDDGVAYNNLALVLAARGRWPQALAAARLAVSKGGAFEAQFRDTLARLCRRQRGSDGASVSSCEAGR